MYMKNKGIFSSLLIDVYVKLHAIYRYIVSTLVSQHVAGPYRFPQYIGGWWIDWSGHGSTGALTANPFIRQGMVGL